MARARKPWFAATLAVAGLLAVAAPASASTAGLQGDTIVFTAAAGERNTVSVAIQAAGIYLRDSGNALSAGPGCALDSSNEVACPRIGVARISVTLGDGDDAQSASASTGLDLPIAVDGGPGADQLKAMNAGSTLTGGPGADVLQGANGPDALDGGSGDDTINGAAGDDTINAADGGFGDLVDCGAGNDSASVDPAIGKIAAEAATGCENVTRPALSVGGFLEGINFTALPGVANDLTVTSRPATMDTLVRDERGLVASTGCDHTTDGDLREMVCSGDAGGDFDLGDGNDRFRGGPAHVVAGAGSDSVTLIGESDVTGGAGNDTLTGGDGDQKLDGGAGNDRLSDRGGFDQLIGGLGDDTFSSRDGSRDDLNCGPGRDRATVDWLDYVFACERYTRGDTSPRAAVAATTKAKTLTTFLTTVREGRFPLLKVPVSCPRAAGAAGCTVTLAVYLRTERRSDVPFHADPVVVAAGTTRTIKLPGLSFGLAGEFLPKARVPSLIAIVTTDAALHTRTSLRSVTLIGGRRPA